MSNDSVTRQPSGMPAGGQFAADPRSEAVGVLLQSAPCPSCGSDDTYPTSGGTIRCNGCGDHTEATEPGDAAQADDACGELDRLTAQFEAAGGRGVGLADRIDALRRQHTDAVETNSMINEAYDALTDSAAIDGVRFDPETGDESETYPHAAHEDAVRALRRYRDASNHVAAGTVDPDRVLTEPLTLAEAVAACDENGFLAGVVEVDLTNLMEAGSEADDLVALLTTGVLPCSAEMEVVGVGSTGALHLRVSTDFKAAYDAEHGDGTFAALRASDKAPDTD